MTVTISYANGVVRPHFAMGVEWTRTANNVVHELVDGESVAVTLRTASKRRGPLSLLFLDEAGAWDANRILALSDVFTFADTDHPNRAMRFIVVDVITVKLDPETLVRWTVDLSFQEV